MHDKLQEQHAQGKQARTKSTEEVEPGVRKRSLSSGAGRVVG